MKYQLTPEMAELGKKHLAIKSGWIQVYHTNGQTREYTGTSFEYLMLDVGLPAHSYSDPPTRPELGYAIARSADGKRWEHVPDRRGETVFDIHTREQRTVTDMGELPESVTVIPPETEFDIWDGTQWIVDITAQRAAEFKAVAAKKVRLFNEATEVIQPLLDAQAGGYINNTDIPVLQAWQKYRYQLSIQDVSTLSEITWPQPPTQLNKSE